MNRSLGMWVGCGMFALLAGCGTATVVKEDAVAFSGSTKQFVSSSRTFYQGLDTRRRDYFATALTQSQHCKLAWKMLMVFDNSPPMGWRCLTAKEAQTYINCKAAEAPPGCLPPELRAVREFDLIAAEKSSALMLIDVISDYQVAIAKVLADPDYDAAGDLKELQVKANKAAGLIAQLGDESEASKIDVTPQIEAVGALVDLLRAAGEDRADLAALRKMMAGDDGASARFDQALVSLKNRYENLDKPQQLLFEKNENDRQLRAFNDNVPAVPAQDRLERAKQIVAERASIRARYNAPDPLADAFDALRKSNRQLREAVVDRKYTPEQRRRIAEQTLKQTKIWFDAITAIMKVF